MHAFAVVALAGMPIASSAQGCANTGNAFPSAVIQPSSNGAVTNISTCNYLSEYSMVGPVVPNAAYEFTVTGNGFITVRESNPTGPVVGAGYSPLVVVPEQGGVLYVHWNVDANCNTATTCQTTTVRLFLDCAPPTVTVAPVDDCVNGQFSLNVNVASLGDAGSLDLVYTVNGGNPQTVADVGTGLHVVGPFDLAATVDLLVQHDGNAACDRTFNGLVSGEECPVPVSCGGIPLSRTYCYGNNDNKRWVYESSSGQSLFLAFSAGSIESTNWDKLRIYNGPDNQSPLLWENPATASQLAGIQVVGGSVLTMEMSSDPSISCQSGGQTEWVWQVGCLGCISPVASFGVVTDCDAQEFLVAVEITELGSDPSLEIVDALTGDVLEVATSTGMYTVGPFQVNIPVEIVLLNSENGLCSLSSGPLVNPQCPYQVPCGGDLLNGQYCYGNNDSHSWTWLSTTGAPLMILFNGGTVESGAYDHLRIYDGDSNAGVLLYENPIGLTDLTGLQQIALSGMMYMEMTSDISVSCEMGSIIQWEWQVECLDCFPPAVSFEVLSNCEDEGFTVMVVIDEMGSDAEVDMINDATGEILGTATAAGSYELGPFPFNGPVVITLVHDGNSLCNVSSSVLVNPLCPHVLTCGEAPAYEQFCYESNDSKEWKWTTSGGEAVIIVFSAGSIESGAYDHLRIYDGNSAAGALLFENPAGVTTELAGLQLIAASGSLFMQMSSDGSISCESGSLSEWIWMVGCMDCTSAVATFAVVPDCVGNGFSIAVDIEELGSDNTLDIVLQATGEILETATGPGVYTVGPFPADVPVQIWLMNSENAFCSILSDTLVNPLCFAPVSCSEDPITDTYCYGNSESHEWGWTSSGGEPLFLMFTAGSIESSTWDPLRIYDGIGPDGILLYQNPGTTTSLSGLFVIANSGSIYMVMTSDGSLSCASGNMAEWAWQVGCLDCIQPVATFQIMSDCEDDGFYVEVDIAELGSDTLEIVNHATGEILDTATAVGTYVVGPFEFNVPVTVTLTNGENALCDVSSPALVNPTCPAWVDCGQDASTYQYCYGNNEDHAWSWESLTGEPLVLTFSAGSMESVTYDQLLIFNGPNENSPLVYQNGMSTTQLAGVEVVASSGKIFMKLISDGTASCQNGSLTQWSWQVACDDGVGVADRAAAGGLALFPNPTTGELSVRLPEQVTGAVDLWVADLAGRVVHTEGWVVDGPVARFDLGHIQRGTYLLTLRSSTWVRSAQFQIMR